MQKDEQQKKAEAIYNALMDADFETVSIAFAMMNPCHLAQLNVLASQLLAETIHELHDDDNDHSHH